MTTRWILAAAAACTAMVSPMAMAQQADDAKAVLAESTKAMQSTPGLTFDAKKYGTGMLKEIIDCDGQVKLMRPAGAKAPMVRVEGRIKQPAQADKKLTYVNDGTVAQWLNQNDNSHYERSIMDTTAQQEFNLAKQLVPDDYFAAQPFANVMKMEKLTKLPNDNIKGEVCDIIQGSTADGSRTITWAISVTDKLPRKMEMSTGMGGNSIAMILEMSNFNTAAKLTPADFTIATPTGYVMNKMTDMPKNPANPVAGNQQATPPVQLGIEAGSVAPAFTLKDADGKEVSLAAMKGNVVVLDFFGSMFKASAVGSAGVQGLSEDFKDKGVKFVGMACRESNDAAAKEYFKNNHLGYTLVPKADSIVSDYKVVGFPSYVVISPDGKVAAFFQNFPGKDVMTSAINQAMATK